HISGCYLGSQLCICTFILSLRPACTPRSPYTTLFRSLSRPEVRYARAAAAERLGDSRRVVELLKNLESQLPLLADTIREKRARADRKSTRLNSSHVKISYAVFCLKKKNRYSRLA